MNSLPVPIHPAKLAGNVAGRPLSEKTSHAGGRPNFPFQRLNPRPLAGLS